MKLEAYLAENKISLGEFARRIGVCNARTVQRYVRGRRPSGPIMDRIAVETGNMVMPNDFHKPQGG